MNDDYYSFNLWKIKEGNEQEFLNVWENELAKAFVKLNPYSKTTLIQSMDTPSIYYSFGPWIKLDQLQAARSSEEYRTAVTKLVSLCDISKSGSFKNLLTITGNK
jgi:heme-degrading monooxygenase HmoA